MNLIFLGAPGSGKGTQADRIEKIYNIKKISTGDILRTEVKNSTSLGKNIADLIGRGKLVPDDIMINLISNKLHDNTYIEGFILDGFPRTINQAKSLEKLFCEKNISLDAVIELQVDYKILEDRISSRFTCARCNTTYNSKSNNTKVPNICNNCMSSKFIHRKDDNIDVLKTRIFQYEEEIKEIIIFYKEKNILYNIDGADSIEIINNKIESIIKSIPNILT